MKVSVTHEHAHKTLVRITGEQQNFRLCDLYHLTHDNITFAQTKLPAVTDSR